MAIATEKNLEKTLDKLRRVWYNIFNKTRTVSKTGKEMIMATTTTKRVTKAQRFEDIKALLSGEAVTYGTTIEDAKAFCDSEISLLAKKNSSEKKPTKTQEQNEGYKALILDFLRDKAEGVTCTDIQKGVAEFADFNNQKISALVRQLAEAGKVVKTTAKGKTLVSLA